MKSQGFVWRFTYLKIMQLAKFFKKIYNMNIAIAKDILACTITVIEIKHYYKFYRTHKSCLAKI
jgi:hypothetical protein